MYDYTTFIQEIHNRMMESDDNLIAAVRAACAIVENNNSLIDKIKDANKWRNSGPLNQEIKNHINSNEDNKIIAKCIVEHFEKFYINMISEFVEKIKGKLKDTFPHEEWLIPKPKQQPIGINKASCQLIAIRHKNWPENLIVRMAADEYRNDVGCGVFWPKQNCNDPKMRHSLVSFMKNKFPNAKDNQWWIYYFNRQHFRNWHRRDALFSIRQVLKEEKPAEIFDSFYNDLVEITEATKDAILRNGS